MYHSVSFFCFFYQSMNQRRNEGMNQSVVLCVFQAHLFLILSIFSIHSIYLYNRAVNLLPASLWIIHFSWYSNSEHAELIRIGKLTAPSMRMSCLETWAWDSTHFDQAWNTQELEVHHIHCDQISSRPWEAQAFVALNSVWLVVVVYGCTCHYLSTTSMLQTLCKDSGLGVGGWGPVLGPWTPHTIHTPNSSTAGVIKRNPRVCPGVTVFSRWGIPP